MAIASQNPEPTAGRETQSFPNGEAGRKSQTDQQSPEGDSSFPFARKSACSLNCSFRLFIHEAGAEDGLFVPTQRKLQTICNNKTIKTHKAIEKHINNQKN